jgi:hypothetical protein
VEKKKKTLVGKVVGNKNMHTYVKDGVDIGKLSMDLEVNNLTWVKSKRTPPWCQIWEGFFSQILVCQVLYFSYQVHHKSRPGKQGCLFLNHLWSDFKFRLNSWCPPCVFDGCIAHVWPIFCGSTTSKHPYYFQCKNPEMYFIYSQFKFEFKQI